MTDLKKVIPEAFYRGTLAKPYVETVGQMIEQLHNLPSDLPIRQGFGEGCTLTVYNVGTDFPHLEFGEEDDWLSDEEE